MATLSAVNYRKQSFWHLFLISLVGLPLISPLLHWTAVPCTHDGHLHYHRIAAMRHAWENGLYFSRWLPDVAFGYGYPFFVYREPTPLFASLFPHLMGMPLPAAENLFYAIAILACGWFMYLWVRDIFGAKAGLVAGVAYMAAPYVLVDAVIRGNSPESLALPLIPFVLWVGRRWVINGRLTPFLLGTLGLAFFSLSHNISLLIFTPFAVVYLLLIGWNQRLTWQILFGRVVLLFGLGLGMSAFYTGGALLELGNVTLEQSTTTRNNDFHYNFASYGEIFGPVAPEDPNLVNPPLDFRLGWAPVALAGLGILFGFAHMFKRETNQSTEPNYPTTQLPPNYPITQLPNLPITNDHHLHIYFMLLSTAVFLFMALPASLFLWENIPLIDFVQFPWRLVGRAALPVAFLAGVPFAYIKNGVLSNSLLVIALGALLIEMIPNTYPSICTEEPFPTINTVHNYEHETGLVGVDPEGSYFPRTVRRRPASSPLEISYQAGEFPQRFAVPDHVSLSVVEANPLSATVAVIAEEPFTAVYQTFDFAGWHAYVNKTGVPITPSDPEGLITFDVPEGRHTLTVQWESTPLRSLLLGLSIVAMAGTVVVAFVLWEKRGDGARARGNKAANSNINQSPRLRASALDFLNNWTAWVFVAGIVLIGLKFGYFDQQETFLRRANALDIPQTVNIQGGELLLTHFSYPFRQDIPSDGVQEINLALTAVTNPSRDYQTNVWLEDDEGHLWSDKNTFRPRKYEDAPRTLFWQPGQWGWESWEIEPLSGTPPGNYHVVMTLFDLETLQPVTLTDNRTGQVLGPTVRLDTVRVVAPETPPVFAPQYPLETAVPNTNITLIGYNQDRTTAQPGEAMTVTIFVEGDADSDSESLDLSLVDENGRIQQAWPFAFGDAAVLEAGQRYRGQRVLNVPGHLDSGTYQFMLSGDVELGTLTVNAPERLFEQPVVETAVNAPFTLNDTAIATLTGYTLEETDDTLSVNLVWQAETTSAVSYRVFVHVVDENGQILAQADGEPANWTRPTTSWATAEFISDSHQLALPDADLSTLQLRIGLYDPATGQRLLTDGGDFLQQSIEE